MTSDLFKEYAKNPTIELRNQLVEENLYMVDILIRKYLGKGVDYDDLYQVGALALVSAVERFDPEKGFEFKSFATPTILGEIKKYFRDKQWSLKVPRRMKEISSKVQEVRDQLTTSLGRAPTLEEISEHTGFSHEQIMQAMESAKAYGTFSLDSAGNSLGDDGEENLLEKYVGFEEIGYERIEINEIITTVLEKL
ncbi:MAG: sigma-70 family RNA polymerase sigma factor, partial [Anaerovoracaceae bacterium]